MIIESKWSGNTTIVDLPITVEQIAEWQGGADPEKVFAHLDPCDYQLLLGGTTREQWGTNISILEKEEPIKDDYEF